MFRILNDYFLVGILEQFEDTLNLFGKVLPSYFRGARDAAESEFAKIAMNTTRYGLNVFELLNLDDESSDRFFRLFHHNNIN